MEFDGVRIDGLLWRKERGEFVPICPKHYLRIQLIVNNYSNCHFQCAEDKETFRIERSFNDETEYIQNKIDAKDLQKLKYVNIDGEYTPIAEDKVSSEDGKYFVRAILTDSKVGLRLVVYAGEKGKEKSQIFVEPEIKRLAFDQTNTHPCEVFLSLEAIFDDGSSASMKK